MDQEEVRQVERWQVALYLVICGKALDYNEREMEVHCIVGTQAGKNLTCILKGYSGFYADYYLQEGKGGSKETRQGCCSGPGEKCWLGI